MLAWNTRKHRYTTTWARFCLCGFDNNRTCKCAIVNCTNANSSGSAHLMLGYVHPSLKCTNSTLSIFGIEICKSAASYAEFCEAMKVKKNEFVESLKFSTNRGEWHYWWYLGQIIGTTFQTIFLNIGANRKIWLSINHWFRIDRLGGW